MGLRIYTVHLPSPSGDDGTPLLVKEGFSWPAFFLGIVWTLWHRLWIESAALLALFLVLGVLLDYAALGDVMESAVLLTVAVLIGASANDWHRQSLHRRGYRDGGIVSGPDTENALRRFLDLRAVESQAVRAAATPGSAPAGSPPPGSAGGGSIAGWYASGNYEASDSTRRLDPNALRSAAPQDRLFMQSQPIPESSDPRRPSSDYRAAGSITLASDQSGSSF